jgi:3-methyladenine DNA glycosylase AlkD
MSRLDVAGAAKALDRVLRRLGNRERAAREKRYLKSDRAFYGAAMPMIRREAKAFVRANPDMTRTEMRALTAVLWAPRVHDLRSVAVAILELRSDLLVGKDAAWLIGLVRDANTWALVDWLAIKVIGRVVERNAGAKRKLSRWAKDGDFWVRRTALLALHDPILRGQGDFALFERLAVPMLGESEFFIRKAIGWVLRSASKRRPERTIAFMKKHAAAASGLTFKEATRNLPKRAQRALAKLRP